MGLGWFSLILFGLSFGVTPENVTSAGQGTTRSAAPDVLHGPAVIATTLVVLAYGAFLPRHFYLAELLAAPAFVIAVAMAFPLIRGLPLGMILWAASMLCLVIAAYRCDGYLERALHPHPAKKPS